MSIEYRLSPAHMQTLIDSNRVLRGELLDASRKEQRAFLRGTILGVLIGFGACVASAAWSLDISGTTVTLQPSQNPAAFADVVMQNHMENDWQDTGAYTLTQDGFVIGVQFTWDANSLGMDQIVVTPPAGMTCQPADCTAIVVESQTGRVSLFQFVGS